MIEQEREFKHFLVHEKERKLTTGTATSYIDYLNNITNHIGVDITSKTVATETDVRKIDSQLLDTDMPDGSRRNCKSAMHAYLQFLAYSKQVDVSVYPDEIERHFEGSSKQVTVNKFERNIKARKACIEHYKAACRVCNLNFVEVYGDMGRDFIHVHHIVPLSEIDEEYQVDPIQDLVPVCPNCHAMLHRKSPPYSVEELKAKILPPLPYK